MSSIMTLRDLQLRQLECVLVLRDVCRREGIEFFLGFGSLLGAVRHGGFIPWDDDIDIVMPRADFERFVALPPSALPTPYRLAAMQRRRAFAKVIMPDVVTLERGPFPKLRTMAQHLFVDVFALDTFRPIPPTLRPAARFLSEVALAGEVGHDFADGLDHPRGPRALGLRTVNALPAALTLGVSRAVLSGRTSTEHLYGHALGSGFGPEYLPAAALFPLAQARFEGEVLPVPADPDAYLRSVYGDWTRLPPEDKRHPAHIVRAVWA